jgi:hypothetical protein
MPLLPNRIRPIDAYERRRKPHESRFVDSCQAICHVFVYISLARAILIASGISILSLILLTLHLLRNTNHAGTCAAGADGTILCRMWLQAKNTRACCTGCEARSRACTAHALGPSMRMRIG